MSIPTHAAAPALLATDRWSGFGFVASIAAAFVLGAIGLMAWAPLSIPGLGVVCHGLLCWLLIGCRAWWSAGLVGLAFGLGLHTTGHGWTYDTLFVQAHAGRTLALIGSATFVGGVALFSAAAAVAYVTLLSRVLRGTSHVVRGGLNKLAIPLANGLLFAVCFSATEYVRGVLTGVATLSLGYTAMDSWADGWLAIAGSHSIGLGFFWLAGMIGVACATARLNARDLPPTLAITALAASVCFGGGLALQKISFAEADGRPLSFRLIQGNFKQQDKFVPQMLDKQVAFYVAAITAAPADLILTPETAMPIYVSQFPAQAWTDLQQHANRHQSNIIFGITSIASDSQGYNSMYLVAPGASALGRYDKVRLMPFGEYTPKGFAWFSGGLSIAMKDMASGAKDQASLRAVTGASSHINIGTLTCLEDLDATHALRWLPAASLIINPSNMAWFDGSLALHHVHQMVRARAMEIARPVLRIGNTGLTLHIDHLGRVLGELPFEVSDVLSGSVQPMKGATPYARAGNAFFFAALGAFAVLALLLVQLTRLRCPPLPVVKKGVASAGD
jgi:apolipoprotein N-acyltransferase